MREKCPQWDSDLALVFFFFFKSKDYTLPYGKSDTTLSLASCSLPFGILIVADPSRVVPLLTHLPQISGHTPSSMGPHWNVPSGQDPLMDQSIPMSSWGNQKNGFRSGLCWAPPSFHLLIPLVSLSHSHLSNPRTTPGFLISVMNILWSVFILIKCVF